MIRWGLLPAPLPPLKSLGLFTAVLIGQVGAGEPSDYRLAAVVEAKTGTIALVEDGAGEQTWYRVGDQLGNWRVTAVNAEGISLLGTDGALHLPLSGDPASMVAAADAPEPPVAHVSRAYRYQYLLSRINMTSPQDEGSGEQGVARSLNDALGLSAGARITSVGRVEVANANQARAELEKGLLRNETIRVRVGNSPTQQLYVMPEE